jgi:hypothetical protein
MRTASLTFRSALACLALATTAHAQSTAPKPMTTKHLLIIGASYAGEWGQPDLPGYRITNKGVGGEESWQVAARFEKDAIAAKPDVILLWGHINDITRTSPDKYEAAKQRAIASYQQMFAQAKAAQIPLVVATEVTLPTAISWKDWLPAAIAWVRGKESYAARVNREVKAMNVWLRQTAAIEKVPLLDLEKAVDDGSGARRVEYTKEDRSHIAPAGYAAITQYVRAQLKP